VSLAPRRWWTKKLARGAFAALGAVAARPRAVVRVLTYHRFGPIARDPFCVSPEDFEAQVAQLAAEGRAVSLDDLRAFALGRRDLPDDACLVTMDDGYASMLEVALPILARHRVPAVAFVTASFVGAPRIDGQPEPFLDVGGLRALHAGGMSIGSHAFTHRSIGRLPDEEAREELRRSRRVLEDHLGAPVTSFAYPFGTHGDFSEATDRALEDAGYELAFHSQHGPVRPGSLDPHGPLRSLPRIKVESGEPTWQFDAATRGALDAWALVDRNLWRFQRVREELAPAPLS
jgi:peptidoglycan/xylan/chitin deacetylase (PgdA/CDA1 family)